MEKKYRFDKINKETLKRFGSYDNQTDWFLRNIGQLDTHLLEKVEGDYIGTFKIIKDKYSIEDNVTYDKRGNEIRRECPNGGTWCIRTYNEDDRATSYRDEDGFWWAKTYDEDGRKLMCITAHDYWYFYTYTKSGKELTYKDSDGDFWTKTYDENDNELTYKDADGDSWTRTYDKNGNELTFEHSNGVTEVTTYKGDVKLKTICEKSGEHMWTETYSHGGKTTKFKDVLGYEYTLTETYKGGCKIETFRNNRGDSSTKEFDEKGNAIRYYEKDNGKEEEWVRTYERTDDYFLQTKNGKPEVKVYFK